MAIVGNELLDRAAKSAAPKSAVHVRINFDDDVKAHLRNLVVAELDPSGRKFA